MPLEETGKYLKIGKSAFYLSACNAQADKMAGEGKIPAVKIEFGKDNKIIICVPYGRRWNMTKETKSNGHLEGDICEHFAYPLSI